MKKTKWPGNWKVACQVCGFWYPSSEIRRRWDGLLVCEKDWETRHPQSLIKVQGERHFPSFVNKEPSPDQFVLVCGLTGVAGYADMGTSDCARAENTTYSYQFLLDVNGNV